MNLGDDLYRVEEPLPPVKSRQSAYSGDPATKKGVGGTYAWAGGRKRQRTQDEEAAIGSATRLLTRVAVPGRDDEPSASAELVDRDGTVWAKDRHAGRDGWAPEGGDDLALRWSSAAMGAAGPFVVMRPSRRSPRR